MHSIHYIDLIRWLIGEPRGVYCKGARHPELPDYADARTTIILDYGVVVRCSLTMNHTHDFGARLAMSQVKVEGTRAAAVAKMGVNLAYPQGEPDKLHLAGRGGDWSKESWAKMRQAGAPMESGVRPPPPPSASDQQWWRLTRAATRETLRACPIPKRLGSTWPGA